MAKKKKNGSIDETEAVEVEEFHPLNVSPGDTREPPEVADEDNLEYGKG